MSFDFSATLRQGLSMNRVACALLFLAVVPGCAARHTRVEPDAGPAPFDADAADAETSASGWTLQTLVLEMPGDSFGPARYADLAIDERGAFHIAHVLQDRGDVLYTRNVSGVWQTSTIEAGMGPLVRLDERSTPGFARLALAPVLGTEAITPLIVYDHGASHGVTRASGWPPTLSALALESSPLDIESLSIARAPSGIVYVAGLGAAVAGTMLRAVRVVGSDGSIAEPTTLRVSNDYRTSLCATADGWLHLAVASDVVISLANRSPAGVWTSRVWAGNRSFPVLAEAPDGRLGIASVRYSTTSSDVAMVYGERLPGSTEFVETELFALPWLQSVDLAFDAEGFAHLAFVGGAALFYATNLSGTWRRQEVDYVNSAEGMPSIAIDAAGNPWIAYRGLWWSLVLATRARDSLR